MRLGQLKGSALQSSVDDLEKELNKIRQSTQIISEKVQMLEVQRKAGGVSRRVVFCSRLTDCQCAAPNPIEMLSGGLEIYEPMRHHGMCLLCVVYL
jgi:hypothetical protein